MTVYEILGRILTFWEKAQIAAPTTRGKARLEDMQFYTGRDDNGAYVEPGYDAEIVIVGNYNDVRGRYAEGHPVLDAAPGQFARIAERIADRAGFRLVTEWLDEWTTCDDCGRLVRTSGDCYEWTRSYWCSDDGGIQCCECTADDPSWYLEWLQGDSDRAETFGTDLAKLGYVKVQDGENGLHDGQADSPSAIAEALRAQGTHDFVFKIDGVGQFDCNFSVWIPAGAELDRGEYEGTDRQQHPNPAAACKAALKSMPADRRHESRGMIAVSTCRADGTSTTQYVTPDQFAEGIR